MDRLHGSRLLHESREPISQTLAKGAPIKCEQKLLLGTWYEADGADMRRKMVHLHPCNSAIACEEIEESSE